MICIGLILSMAEIYKGANVFIYSQYYLGRNLYGYAKQ